MSGRKPFILKFNYLFYPRGGVQNPDNKINTRRLEKLILTRCFPSLREGMFSAVFCMSPQRRTRRALSMEAPAGEAKGRSSPSWFNPPNCGFFTLFEVYTLAISLTTDQAINKMFVISNSMFSFPERNGISFPNYIRKLVSIDYNCLMHVLNIYSTCFLCQVKCCGWHRCKCPRSSPHPACHLLGVSNHFSCPPSPFCFRWHHLWGDTQYLNKSNDCSTNLYFFSFWCPVTRTIFLRTTLMPLPFETF